MDNAAPGSSKGKKTLWYNIAFVAVSAAILAFLLMAPEETTKKLPRDDIHLKFYPMGKKAAEKFCPDCHRDGGEVPFPEGHPPKNRCLFCHKKITR